MTEASLRCSAFGAAVNVAAVAADLIHAPFTLLLIFEQIKTGWGYGTDVEMFALYPWMIEFLALPILPAEIVFLILSIFLRPKRSVLLLSAILTGLLISQYVILNLFLFY